MTVQMNALRRLTTTILLSCLCIIQRTTANNLRTRKAVKTTSGLSRQQYQQNGESWLRTVEQNLISEDATRIVGDIVDNLDRTRTHVYLVGSWPAKLIAEMRKQDGFAAPTLIANDVDVFYLLNEDDQDDNQCGDELEVIFESIEYYDWILPGEQRGQEDFFKVNTVGTRCLDWNKVLENNDVDATGVVLEAYRDFETAELHWTFHVSSQFWQFLLSQESTGAGTGSGSYKIRPTHAPQETNVGTLVRIAYKAMQMNLDYDIHTIDPTNGFLSTSHMKKVKAMEGWERNPFKDLTIVKVEGNSYWEAYKVVRDEPTVQLAVE